MNTKKAIPAATALQRYHYLEGRMEEAKQKKEAAEKEIRACEFQITLFTAWLEEIQSEICPACHGHGKLREFLAQDETCLIRCPECGGTGVRTKPQEQEK